MSDLTDRRNGLRIVVTAKRGHSAETIRDQLLALTPLESTFAASLVALDEDRVPRWWSVRELISAFLHLRDSVVLHRSEYRLEKVTARRHLVAGLMKIHLDIDAAVAVIRGSDTSTTPDRACRSGSRSTKSRPITFWRCSFAD